MLGLGIGNFTSHNPDPGPARGGSDGRRVPCSGREPSAPARFVALIVGTVTVNIPFVGVSILRALPGLPGAVPPEPLESFVDNGSYWALVASGGA